jgi:CPA1 family monovalent cation:H+ antiporter
MELTIENGALLLLLASLVAIVARRLDIPYSVGLVVVGIAIARLPAVPGVTLTPELLFGALLPPLIFEAVAFSIITQGLTIKPLLRVATRSQ